MAPLPPMSWIIIGAIVVVVALFLPQLILFGIVGVIFVLIGVTKLIGSRRSRKRPAGQPTPNHTYHRDAPGKEAQPNHKRCWVCSTINPSQAHFCFNCGHRLS